MKATVAVIMLASTCFGDALIDRMDLRSPGRVELPARQVRHVAHGGRADCAVCGTLFSGAQIVTGPMRWDADLQGGVVDRALYCAGCEHVQRWVEGIDLDGRPNGSAVGEPELVREPGDIDRFLEEHPEAAGMAVA